MEPDQEALDRVESVVYRVLKVEPQTGATPLIEAALRSEDVEANGRNIDIIWQRVQKRIESDRAERTDRKVPGWFRNRRR